MNTGQATHFPIPAPTRATLPSGGCPSRRLAYQFGLCDTASRRMVRAGTVERKLRRPTATVSRKKTNGSSV